MTAPNFKTAKLPADAIEVGRIGEAWGIKGWVKIWPHDAQAHALSNSKNWWLQFAPPASNIKQNKFSKAVASQRFLPLAAMQESSTSVADGIYKPNILTAKQHNGSLVVQFAEVDSRNQAEMLKGATIWLSRKDFPTVGKGEYYWIDLIGCKVINLQDIELGTVQDLLAAGPQTTLVIDPTAEVIAQRELNETVLIPFVKIYIKQVDISTKIIQVDWQADY